MFMLRIQCPGIGPYSFIPIPSSTVLSEVVYGNVGALHVPLRKEAFHCVLTVGTELRQNLVTVDSCRGGQCPRTVSHLLRGLALKCLGLKGKADVMEDLLRFVANCIISPAGSVSEVSPRAFRQLTGRSVGQGRSMHMVQPPRH
jgi:hypothetical protein